ncbi:MAG: SulP family inorganic anion transporter [Candidatus Gastranaerophilales bacterium]|nr:SulP family inorganic anion transporter [Candidatus Gastranaerophilales bacterium]
MIKGVKSQLKTLSGDMLGAVVAAIVTLPQALAFGVATGFGAAAGLWGVIILCTVTGLINLKVPVVSGITGPVTIVAASVMLSLNYDISAVLFVIFIAGLLQIALGFSGLAKIMEYVPYPVISGFMNGVGFILIIMQLNPLIGHQVQANTVLSLKAVFANLSSINMQSLIPGILTLVIVFMIPKRINKFIPSQVIALVFCTMISVIFKFDIERIGEVSLTNLNFHIPQIMLNETVSYFNYALVLAIVMSSESLMTGLVCNSITKTGIDTKKLLIGQGLGNAISSLFGGVPGSAALMRTVAAINAGAATRMCTLITPVIIVFTVLQFANYLELIPMSVLSGILIKVGYDIIDTKLLRVIKYAPKDDLYILVVVFVLTLFYNLIAAVGAGITLAALLYAKRTADNAKLVHTDENGIKVDITEKRLERVSKHKIRIVHIDGSFFFGSATQIVSQFDEFWGTKCLILDCRNDRYFDVSAIFAFEDIIMRLKSQEIVILLVLSGRDIKKQLDKFGITDKIGGDRIFYSLKKAMISAKSYVQL